MHSSTQYFHQRRDQLLARLGGKCVVCGTDQKLEMDHIDPATKLIESRSLVTLSWSRSEVAAEIAKLQLLCADHHREKTIAERAPFRHGTIYGFMTKKCRCADCDATRVAWHAARNEQRRQPAGRGTYGRPADHGTRLRYRRGCRCAACRAGNAADQRARRAAA